MPRDFETLPRLLSNPPG